MRSRQRQKLKEAKKGLYNKNGGKNWLSWVWMSRQFHLALRTAAIVLLFRIIFMNDVDVGDEKTTGEGGGKPKSDTVVTPKSSPITAPPKQAPAITKAPTPAPTTAAPAYNGPLRIWEWKNDGSDPLKFAEETKLPQYKTIIFIGDSRMSHFAGNMQDTWGTVFPLAHFTGKVSVCHRLSYFNMRPPASQPRPDHKQGEGPYGVSNQNCGVCADCKLGKIGSGSTKPYGWEYLYVDYARDVEAPSSTTATTQETVALYLKNSAPTTRLCVVNGGYEDMAIPGITVDIFLRNLKQYLHLISPQCEAIVWFSIAATTIRETDMRRPQNNARIEHWNTLIMTMMTADPILANKVVYLDIYQASAVDVHYRAPLTKLFTGPIEKAIKSRLR